MSARVVKSPGDGVVPTQKTQHMYVCGWFVAMPAFSAERVRDGVVPTQKTQHMYVCGWFVACLLCRKSERGNSSHRENREHVSGWFVVCPLGRKSEKENGANNSRRKINNP